MTEAAVATRRTCAVETGIGAVACAVVAVVRSRAAGWVEVVVLVGFLAAGEVWERQRLSG